MMKQYLIEIISTINNENQTLTHQIKSLGYNDIQIFKRKIYMFKGDIEKNKIKFIVENLLVDPVIETYEIKTKILSSKLAVLVNIWYKPEVLDVESLYITKAVKYMGVDEEVYIKSGLQLLFQPKVKKEKVKEIVEKLFMNPLIQYYEVI